MQFRINHCADGTMGGQNVHKPQVLCMSTYFMTYTFGFLSPALCLKCDNGSYLTADSLCSILAGQPKVLVKPLAINSSMGEATGHWQMTFLF